MLHCTFPKRTKAIQRNLRDRLVYYKFEIESMLDTERLRIQVELLWFWIEFVFLHKVNYMCPNSSSRKQRN